MKSREISDGYVAVRLTGGNDITPEVEAFMQRYRVRGYPTLYVMNAAGHVVVPGVGRTVDAMLEALAKGRTAENEFAAMPREGADAKAAYLQKLQDRMAWDEVIATVEADVKSAPSEDLHMQLWDLYQGTGRAEDERVLLAKMADLYTTSEARTAWRVRLATMDTDPRRAKSAEDRVLRATAAAKALEGLLATTQAEKDTAAEQGVRLAIGMNFQLAGNLDLAEQQFDAVLAADPKGKAAPTALMGRANVAWGRKDWAACKARLQQILSDHPESEEAKRAPQGIQNCERKLAEKK